MGCLGELGPTPHSRCDVLERSEALEAALPGQSGRRLPMLGAVLTRDYRNMEACVRALDEGFEYLGEACGPQRPSPGP
jgi:hypothetical protein